MHRIACVALLVGTLGLSVAARSAEHNYEIEISGMVCAFCAYTVGKNLATLPGVVADSVSIDLERGVAMLQSTQKLDAAAVEETILESGFNVAGIASITEIPAVSTPTTQVVKLTLNDEQIGSKMADQLLDVLGATALRIGGELRVIAPGKLESDILKPLIAGRQRAIKVRFESSAQGTVQVSLYH
ncbi:MAG: heavy-metal-associated domain-containing protein [Gammaproteobacteria bacterium]|nr:heavy-metal-associated domain-containing protein [Gammaproteobacteria bacterium]MCZ6659295.1 heavy-metal-associated domain-containing protein [Gammaproteobacteria bacterium]